MPEGWTEVTTARRRDDAASIAYGLRIRGIPAQTAPTVRPTPDPWCVIVPPEHAERAREAVPHTWDVVLEFPRAVTGDGLCAFCGYDVKALPHDLPCPECGVDLSSVEARRAVREGRPTRP